MSERKKIIAQIIEEAELLKIAQQVEEQAPENEQAGKQTADQVFDKFLAELDIDSV